MSKVNPSAEQLLSSKYAAVIKLIQERADIDSRIMIVMTDISQITGATFINAPVGALEGDSAPAETPSVTKPTTAKKTEEKKPVEQAEEPAKEEEVKIPEQAVINKMVNEIAGKGDAGKAALQKLSKTMKPYKSSTDEEKLATYELLKGLLDG